MLKINFVLLLLFFSVFSGYGQNKIVVIGIDGMSVPGLKSASTPIIDSLMSIGSFSLKARAVMPTKSSPNWASMISGAGPEQHGVLTNGWQRDKVELEPTCKGKENIFPTMFSVVRTAYSDLDISVYHDWKAFGRLVEGSACTILKHTKNEKETLETVVEHINSNSLGLLFAHFDHVDHALHKSGHMSKAYVRQIEKADSFIGEICQAISKKYPSGEVSIIVTSDHGGKGRKHGGSSLQEMQIPWIIAGYNINNKLVLDSNINTYDTAATIVKLFNIDLPECWIAKPVFEAIKE